MYNFYLSVNTIPEIKNFYFLINFSTGGKLMSDQNKKDNKNNQNNQNKDNNNSNNQNK